MSALHLSEPETSALQNLSEPEWREALAWSDRARLTLALREAALTHMPAPVRDRVDANAAANRERLHRAEETYRSLMEWLGEAGLEFVALKGLTHAALFGASAESRVQYDVDLLLPPETAQAAQHTLIARGYHPLPGMENHPTGHLPALIRQTGWQWRGDFFDTEMPLALELHNRLWTADVECVPAPGVEEFWSRRTVRPVGGVSLGVLCPQDALAYASLHLLKHLLRGSLKPFHAYELARLLQATATDSAFWEAWHQMHPAGLRVLETIGFRLAQEWFGGHSAPEVQAENAQLPPAVQAWFGKFALAPACAPFHSNKDELWLHLSLIASRRDRLKVALRRLAPHRIPQLNTTAHIPDSQITRRQRAVQRLQWASYVASRSRHHTAALAATLVSGARWWWRTNRLGGQFWIFLAAAVVFNFGLFVFVLLYNLFLLDLGFREDFVGTVSAAQRAGSVAGTLPGAWIAHRFGLKKTMVGAIAGIALTEVLRALIGARLPIASLAFAAGFLFSAWAVILAPSIAGLVEEKLRPTAFSVFFATMFSVGIAGNWAGGWLPVWMHGKRAALLLAGTIAGMAVLPALRLRPTAPAAPGERVYPHGGFLWRFLAPFAVWHLATGAFNPFNNVYFARLGFPVQRIGSIFSASQLVQVLTVLTAPLITRRFGLLTGIIWMMAATSLGLFGLAVQPPGAAAVAVYIAYMSFQWMSEPGLNSLLMSQVPERERGGASALNFLAAFGAQALAAWTAGTLFRSLGYGPVLAGAAGLAVAAALMFYALLGSAARAKTASRSS